MEMRKCKECGKLFMPKGREQYCSDIHYRPCPVCGESVIAKYLSDPPRRCDKCKGVKGTPNLTPAQPSASTSEVKSFKPMQSIKPIQAMKPISSTFKLEGTSKTDEPKKPTPALQPAPSTRRNREIPPRLEEQTFCNTASGSKFQFIRDKALCGWIPGHTYIVKVDKDTSAYIVTSEYDTTDDKPVEFKTRSGEVRNSIALRFASQTSFYDYFTPAQAAELSVD